MKFLFAAAVAASVVSAQGWDRRGPPPARGPPLRGPPARGPPRGYQDGPARVPLPPQARPQIRRAGPPKGYGRTATVPREYGVQQRSYGYRAGPGPVRRQQGPIRRPPQAVRGPYGPVDRVPRGVSQFRHPYAVAAEPEQVEEPVEEVVAEEAPAEEVVEEVAAEEPEAVNIWGEFNGLNIDNFKSTVVDDKENVWVVAFISPTCNSCHVLADEWKQLRVKRSVTNRKIKFGYVDIAVSGNREILGKFCGDNKIKYTPTVLLYG